MNVNDAIEVVLGRKPTSDERREVVVGLTPTNEKCGNALCDGKLLAFQARFCTRCWKAIETCREVEAKWKAEGR